MWDSQQFVALGTPWKNRHICWISARTVRINVFVPHMYLVVSFSWTCVVWLPVSWQPLCGSSLQVQQSAGGLVLLTAYAQEADAEKCHASYRRY